VKSEHSKRDEEMEERRRAPRIKEENKATIKVVSGGKNLPEEEINDNQTKDISVCGAKIHTNILLPVNTLLELDFTSKGVHKQIKILGKVIWRKVINENESYEFGVEFYPSKEIEKLDDYISGQLKSNKSEFIKNMVTSIDSGNKNIVETKKLSPIDSGYINIVETKKISPIDSGYINIVETKKISPIDSGNKNSVETKKVPPIDSGYINIVETKKISPIDSGNKNSVETKKVPPIKNKQWIKIAIILLGTIILIVVLLKIFGSISLDFIYPHTNKKVTNNFAHDSIVTESATLPAPPITAPVPAPVPAPAPAPVPAPAPKATQKTKVIGNSDSKIYHLPGMKYYNAVKAYHRVEFDSETDAIKAGYNKAPR
jgi:PilZ domain